MTGENHMPMPTETQQLIKQALTMVRNDLGHHLSPATRYDIYESFGDSRLLNYRYLEFEDFSILSFADNVLSWLTILTVRHVMPIWEHFVLGQKLDSRVLNAPTGMLKIAEGFLRKEISHDYAFGEFHETFYYGIDNYQKILDFRMYCIYMAAYDTMDVVLQGFNVEHPSLPPKDKLFSADFATRAMLANSISNEKSFSIHRKFDDESLIESGIEIDLSKRLEFWEWWLTEAIPQAWELAEGTRE